MSARLPTPGGDAGNWGEILNQFLEVEHNDDGSLKSNGSLAGKASASDVTALTTRVSTSIAADGSLTTAATDQAVAAAQVDAKIADAVEDMDAALDGKQARFIESSSTTAVNTPVKELTISGYTPTAGDLLLITLPNGHQAPWLAFTINGGAALTARSGGSLVDSTFLLYPNAQLLARLRNTTNSIDIIAGYPSPSTQVSLNTDQTITGTKTFNVPGSLVAVGGDISPAMSEWFPTGAATYSGGTWTLTGAFTLTAVVSVVAGKSYKISLPLSSAPFQPASIALGSAVVAGLLVTASSSSVIVAKETGDIPLTVGLTATSTITSGAKWTLTEFVTIVPDVKTRGVEVRSMGKAIGIGTDALRSFTDSASPNIAIGANTLRANYFSSHNVAIGDAVLPLGQNISNTVAIGDEIGTNGTAFAGIVALGHYALQKPATSTGDVAIGGYAIANAQTSGQNVAVGFNALRGPATGTVTPTRDVAIGNQSLYEITTGTDNVALGYYAGYSPNGVNANATKSASKQTIIGSGSGQSSATQVDEITTVGYRALAGGAGGTSLGASASAPFADSVALGRSTVTTATSQVAVGARDVEIQHANNGVVLKSPDGSRWRMKIDDTGAVTTTKL